MPKSVLNLNNLSAGLVSAKVSSRTDQAKYGSWSRQLQNMIPYRSGGITRSPGTYYVANAKYANTGGNDYAVRLISFTFSPSTQFMLEVGDHYIRFYSNDLPVHVSSAPLWVAGGPYYFPGTFVTDPDNGLIYFTETGSGINAPPHTNPAEWIQQTILEVYTPYSGNALTTSIYDTDVFQVTPCQINDVVYFVHPDFPPYKLERITDTNWTMQQVEFDVPPLLDQNITNTVLTPTGLTDSTFLQASAPAWTAATYYQVGNSVEVLGILYECIVSHTSSAVFTTDLTNGKWEVQTIFYPEHLGSTWQLKTLRAAQFIEYDGTAAGGFTDGTSGTILCVGSFTVRTYGVWSSDVAIQRSVDNGNTWTTVFTITSRSDNNNDIAGTGSIGVQALYRIVVSNSAALISPGATDPRIVLSVDDAFLSGLVKITEYLTPYTAIGQVLTQLYDNPASTPYWSEGAWSDKRGYPKAIACFQQRFFYASSEYEPQRLWGTNTNDIENFDRSDPTKATNGLAYDLNAPGRGPILSLIAQGDLFVLFSGAEWVVNSGTGSNTGTGGGVITPTDINAVEQGTYGSAPYIQPQIVGNAVFFAQRQADAIRQMLFSIYTTKYMSQDITAVADTFFAAGVVQMAYQSRWRHQGILWSVVKDGSMLGLSYDLDQEVFGWCKRVTGYNQTDAQGQSVFNDKGFESVGVLFANGTPDDEVWVVANRLIDGVSTRFIERVTANNWEETFYGAGVPAPQLNLAYYVDCGLTVFSPGSRLISGLSHLEGRYVVGLADSTSFGPLQVTGGVITLPDSIPESVAAVNVGLQQVYAGQPMRIDSDAVKGNTQGLKKAISDLFIIVYNSMGGQISNGTANYRLWVSGTSYPIGTKVISPSTLLAYECVTVGDFTTDPSASANWVQTALPAFREPVNIPYTQQQNDPFAVPQLDTDPTEKWIQPQGDPVITSDPVFIVQGRDALPLTILSVNVKYDIISTP